MMQAPSSQVQSLPFWAQIVSFAIALILALIRLVEFFRIPELDVRLTRDLFFRLIDSGEALFCHAVLLARNGPVLIQDITIMLKRVGKRDRAEKQYPIQILNFGEKVKGPAITAEHHFYSSSPLLYLAENTPLRAVYLGVQREYHASQQRTVQEFIAKILELKEKYAQTPTESLEQETGQQALSEIDALIKDSYNKMLALIQLEIGHYEATIKVTYQIPGFKLWRRQGHSQSTISFSVEEQPLSNWKTQLSNTLRVQAMNLLRDSNNSVDYPTFQPVDFEESGQQIGGD